MQPFIFKKCICIIKVQKSIIKNYIINANRPEFPFGLIQFYRFDSVIRNFAFFPQDQNPSFSPSIQKELQIKQEIWQRKLREAF